MSSFAPSPRGVPRGGVIRGGGDFLLRLVARDTAQENELTRKLTEVTNVGRVQTLQTIRTSRTLAGVPL